MRQTAAGDSLISHAGVCTWGMTLSVSLSLCVGLPRRLPLVSEPGADHVSTLSALPVPMAPARVQSWLAMAGYVQHSVDDAIL
jgi:hypothetical protein